MPADIAAAGKAIDNISVHLSYKLIDIFSGHLYKSPIKAVEELVANSYDAFADHCVVSVPDTVADGSIVWIWDDGDSMDIEGLKELWTVAESKKRDEAREKLSQRRGRLPIGKFGIGKLASYALGKRITHICKRKGKYLAVTMDYNRLSETKDHQDLKLSVRQLNESELRALIPFVKLRDHGCDTDLNKTDSWTLVIIDRLKEQLPIGRLRWVLETALPLTPDFMLFFDGSKVESSKERIKRLARWQIGKNDTAATEHGFASGKSSEEEEPFNYFVDISPYGKISGTVELFDDPLTAGKALDIGRSHGFFIMIRKRMINAADPLFGITTLPHLAFNRFRAVVHADFLDQYLNANREEIADAAAKNALQKYLAAKFNEVRHTYEKHLESQVVRRKVLEEHLKTIPGTLLDYPLRHAIERIIAEKYTSNFIRITPGEKPKPEIEKIELKLSDSSEPFATLAGGKISINTGHPFYADFAEFPGIRKLALAEVLLEAYLLEAGVDAKKTGGILEKRDQLLRILASNFPEGGIKVAQFIRDSVNSEENLEIAGVDGFNILGFSATKLGQSGKPDGIATAPLGISQAGQDRKYVVSIDMKSTQDEAVQSGNVGMATIARHKREVGAKYAVVIAPGYQDKNGDDSKVVKEARQEGVCLIRASDFADLVAASTVKPLSLERLEELFKKTSPQEASDWIRSFMKENPPKLQLRSILDTVWRMQSNDRKDAPQIAAIRYAEPSLQNLSSEELEGWLNTISRLVPELVSVISGKVQLNQAPENIIKQCVSFIEKLPVDVSAESLLKGLKGK